MKRLLAFLLVMVLAISFAGCTSKKSGSSDADGGVPTLTWLVPGEKQPDVALVMEEVNKILVEKIGAKLDLQFIDTGAYNEKMTMFMASGDEYDLCFTGYINKYQDAARKGGLMQLDELLKTTPDLVKALPDYIWDIANFNGGIYAVPNQQFIAQRQALYIKKDLADKYGLDPATIKQTTDIEPFLEKVKNGEPGIYPFRSNYGTGSFASTEIARNSEEVLSGIAVTKKEDKFVVSSTYDDAGFRERADLLHDWFKKGYIRPDVASVMDDTQDQKAGKYAVYVSGYAPGSAASESEKWGWDVIAIPVSRPYITMNAGKEALTGIGKRSKHPELAIKLLELVNTDKEIFNLISYGIEGKHYNKLEGDYISLIKNSGYSPSGSWTFGNTFNGYLVEGQEADVYEQIKALNDGADRSGLSGFVLDTTNIRTEISQLEAVRGEYKVVNNGSMDPAKYYDDFLKELDKAGIDIIIKEVQKQVDEFVKNK